MQKIDFNNVNKLYLAVPLLVLVAGIYFTFFFTDPNTGNPPVGTATVENYQKNTEAANSLETLKQELETLKIEKQQREQAEKLLAASSAPGQVIYQTQGLSFAADASFAPLFENVIDYAKTSGIRIRSIDYNYSPAEDPIFAAKLPGYNVCELNITAVGSYSQFQAFFKSIYSQHYLSNIAEVEIEPWENNQSILITNMKLRLYTKT